jgi:hypothetical protein
LPIKQTVEIVVRAAKSSNPPDILESCKPNCACVTQPTEDDQPVPELPEGQEVPREKALGHRIHI